MPSFYEMQGQLFDAARARIKKDGPSSNYMIKSIEVVEGEYEYFYAVFAPPGSMPEFVIGEDGGPAIYRDREYAHEGARKALINELNAVLAEQNSN